MFFLNLFISDKAFNFLLEKYFNSGYIIYILNGGVKKSIFCPFILSVGSFFLFNFRLLVKTNIKEFKLEEKLFTGAINFFLFSLQFFFF